MRGTEESDWDAVCRMVIAVIVATACMACLGSKQDRVVVGGSYYLDS